ncbi:DUF7662 domain-containing protein [Coralliovum pocilloporae]|uniref:DUF7662 domain-containing protein n=1 Tax=Coralliovum pocilloporae TaxID=3066369 RepID=UPI003306D22F
MGKYQTLTDHLAKHGDGEWSASFDDIEALLGFSLPRSAVQHRTWWANSGGTQVHQNAWLSVGWRVADVDPVTRLVRFHRADIQSGDARKRSSAAAEITRKRSSARGMRLRRSDSLQQLALTLDWQIVDLADRKAKKNLLSKPAILQIKRSDDEQSLVVGQVEDLKGFIGALKLEAVGSMATSCKYVHDSHVVFRSHTTDRMADFQNPDDLDLVELFVQTGLRMAGVEVLILT